ncbi:hypothetical protein IKG45_02850 [Candidatus Saccharibacteria bacterium]|nr:hypothetical protein [Candidatus Saccharibacteria bacterium]
MPDFQISGVPPAWQTDPLPLIITSTIVIVIILITIILVRKELKNEKKK